MACLLPRRPESKVVCPLPTPPTPPTAHRPHHSHPLLPAHAPFHARVSCASRRYYGFGTRSESVSFPPIHTAKTNQMAKMVANVEA